ncbi:alpha/beta fold hydrolase [Streptomyces sp. NPDC007896]|uniref:alpha/beta fold hydrolase n=1 Tax=Streptomyces sp. NPDC007896 TaxID=3364784 RepID=UPI0036E39A09
MSLRTSWGEQTWVEEGEGPLVLLLHPLALAGEFWRPLMRAFSSSFRVVAPDARGHGGSTWDGTDFSVEDMAADAAALLEHLGAPAAVVGLSMGGCAATALAVRRPDLVTRLVLADTTADYGPGKEAAWEGRAVNAVETPREQQLKFQHDRWFSPTFLQSEPAEVDRVSAIFVGTDSTAHAAACRALGRYDDSGRLGDITAPTLVLVGDEDYATPPPMAQALHRGIRDSQLVVLDRTRHMSLIQNREIWPTVLAHLKADTESSPATES